MDNQELLDESEIFVHRKKNVHNTKIILIIIDVIILTFFFVFMIINIVNWNNPGVGSKDARPVNRVLFFFDLAITIIMGIVVYFEVKRFIALNKIIKVNNSSNNPIAFKKDNILILFDTDGNEYYNPSVSSMYHKSGAIYAKIGPRLVFLGWFSSKEEYNNLLNYLSN